MFWKEENFLYWERQETSCIVSLAGGHRKGNWVDKVGSSDCGLLSWSECAVKGDQSIVEFVATRKPGISGLQGRMASPHLMFCSTCAGPSEQPFTGSPPGS